MEKYKNLGMTIGGFRALSIESKPIPYDNEISGRLGAIWEVGDGKGTLRLYYANYGREEKIITFDSKHLRKAVAFIDGYLTVEEAVYYANNVNARLDRSKTTRKRLPKELAR